MSFRANLLLATLCILLFILFSFQGYYYEPRVHYSAYGMYVPT